jgi:hypothetical protein
MIHVRGQVHPSVCQQVTCNLAPFSDCVLVAHLAAWYVLILLLTGSLLTVEYSKLQAAARHTPIQVSKEQGYNCINCAALELAPHIHNQHSDTLS